ncbi:MAG: hypothetical protein JSV84_09675 [Gemmatimonadota bacterium]|nr:MAG: hypothetical protein JSV84_09675 [Gemmatimonadota bacterium]
MKSFKLLLWVAMIFVALGIESTFAQFAPPARVINYQGRLVDFQGNIVHDTLSITFSIYNIPEEGAPLWTETHHSVVVWGGVYNVLLGSLSPDGIPDTAFNEGGERWLGVQIGSNSEMRPRQPLVSVPSALNSNMLDGKHADQFLCSDRADTMGGCAPDIPFLTVINECAGDGILGMTNGGNGVKGWGKGTSSYGGYFVSDNFQGLYAQGGGGNEAAYLDGDVTITGQVYVTDTTPSISPGTGALVVEGGVGVGDNLNVAHNIIGSGLKVVGPGQMGPDGQHVAYFENTDGGNEDGVAIKLRKENTSSDNHFMTFYRGSATSNTVAGRIEGFTYPDDAMSLPPMPDFKKMFDLTGMFDPGKMFELTNWSPGKMPWGFSLLSDWDIDIDVDWDLDVDIDIDWPSIGFNPGIIPELTKIDGKIPWFDFLGFSAMQTAARKELQPLICWALDNGYENLITADPFDLMLAVVILDEQNKCNHGGVTYASGGADYAEWLPKLDPEEKMSFSQLVGVHDGKVSKTTAGTDQIMAVSVNPVVVGNMPPKGEESGYVKVGFLGQVRVLVRGSVEMGDYIVPSGNDDGTGIAVSPEDLRLAHVSQVLGRAWSASTNDRMNLINVLIGTKTNELVEILEQQQEKIQQLESRLESLAELESRVEKLEALLSQEGPDHRTTMVTEESKSK